MFFVILLTVPSVAVVGLEMTFYQVSEDVGVVEVCAIVYNPMSDCPIEFLFDVRLTTLDGSAGKKIVKHAYICLHLFYCKGYLHEDIRSLLCVFLILYYFSISHELIQKFDLWCM